MGDVADFAEDTGDWFEENVTSKVKEYGKYVSPYGWAQGVAGKSMAGGQPAGESIKEAGASFGLSSSPSGKREAAASSAAAADAAVAQAEYEEQAARGSERSRARRRKGFQSTVLTGGPATLGGGLADSDKTLLGG